MSEWPVTETATEYDCGWFTVGYDVVEQPSGGEGKYYWVDRPTNGLGIVAVRDSSVAMVEQYRPKLGDTFLECPGGDLKDGESYHEAAARELLEETGLQAGTVELLTTYYPAATMRYERGIVVATDLTESEPDPDEAEFIDWRFVPATKAIKQAMEPQTTGWTLTALLAAKDGGHL